VLWRPDGVLRPGRPMNAVVEDLKKQIAQVGSISAAPSRSGAHPVFFISRQISWAGKALYAGLGEPV
jgi:hypothetical protein